MEQLKFYTRLVANHLIWKARLIQQQKWDGNEELEKSLEAFASVGQLAHLLVIGACSWGEEQGAVWRKEKKDGPAGHTLATNDEDIRE